MQRCFLLNIALMQSAPIIFQYSPTENELLLIGVDALFVLDPSLDVTDSVISPCIDRENPASWHLHKDVTHTSKKTKHQVKGTLVLDEREESRERLLVELSLLTLASAHKREHVIRRRNKLGSQCWLLT